MEYQDYYKVLGVARDASAKDIKSAYRKLTKKYHPDVNKGDANAEAKYRQINEAYEVLGDPDKRSKYDQFGSQWEHYQKMGGNPFGGGGAQTINLEDLLRQFGGGGQSTGGRSGRSSFFDILFGNMGSGMGGAFSGGSSPFGGSDNPFGGSGSPFGPGSPFGSGSSYGSSGPRQSSSSNGKDLECSTTISLEEAYKGTNRTVTVERVSECPVCGGRGSKNSAPCDACMGSGKARMPRKIDVRIPAGIVSGAKMRVRGEGEPGARGGSNGDMFLQVNIDPGKEFTVKGKDVECELWISLYDALFGGSVDFVAPSGSTLSLKIKAGTQNGARMKLAGLGLPNSKGKGDLYVRLMVTLPTSLSAEEEKAFRKLDNRKKIKEKQ
ncbi:MAG: DnaJ C-terminal domain-containing protein [bacterium]|nr:DnaJ C-terminal domain-containing protein [bacterium]